MDTLCSFPGRMLTKFAATPCLPLWGRWQLEGLLERALSVSFADSSPTGRAKWRSRAIALVQILPGSYTRYRTGLTTLRRWMIDRLPVPNCHRALPGFSLENKNCRVSLHGSLYIYRMVTLPVQAMTVSPIMTSPTLSTTISPDLGFLMESTCP